MNLRKTNMRNINSSSSKFFWRIIDQTKLNNFLQVIKGRMKSNNCEFPIDSQQQPCGDINENTNPLHFICQAHQGKLIQFISIDSSSQQSVFKCDFCVTEEKDVSEYSLIPIEQIFSHNSRTIFTNFPFKDRELTNELIRITNNRTTEMKAVHTQVIESFFKEIKAKIISSLDIIQSKVEEKSQNNSEYYYDVLFDLYNKICSKSEFQRILSDPNKSLGTKSADIKEICANIQCKHEENKNQIEFAIKTLNNQLNSIDMEALTKSIESIMNQLKPLNSYLIQLFDRLSSQYPIPDIQQDNHQSSHSILPHDLIITTSDHYSNLITNNEQKEDLKYTPFETPIPPPTPSSGDANNQSNLDQTQIISQSAQTNSLTAKYLELLSIHNQIQEDDEQETQKVSAKELIMLISNSTNFCSDGFKADISSVLQQLERILEQFRVRKPHIKTEYRNSFQDLTQSQLISFSHLAKQVSFLSKNMNQEYLHSTQPSEIIQPNSKLIRDHISQMKLIPLNQQAGITNMQQQLDQLLVDYPIFDLLPEIYTLKKKPLPLSTEFRKSKCRESESMELKYQNNQLELTFCSTWAQNVGQIVTQPLKNDCAYALRLTFNQSYVGTSRHGSFRIGLILGSRVDIVYALSHNSNAGFCSKEGQGARIVVKGNSLSDIMENLSTNSLEFRWCVAKRQFFIADSSYQSVNQVEESFFDPNEIYHFAVCFFGIEEKNWKITIQEFSEINPDHVSRFD